MIFCYVIYKRLSGVCALILRLDNTMGFQQLTFYWLCFTSVSFNVYRYTHCLTLSIRNNDNFENTDAILRCSDDGNFLGVVRWIQKPPLQTALMTIRENNCTTSTSFIQNSSLYSYDCTDGTVYTLTIKKISRDKNGQLWRCDLGFNNAVSNEVIIYVKVPVSTTSISPNNNVILRSEKSILSLTCTTSECRPEPKFIWYKGNSVMTDGDETILSQSGGFDSSATTIQAYTSSFSITLTRDLNGWFLFCSAGNYIGSFVPSNKIQLNVTYPPDRSPIIDNFSNRSQVRVIEGDNVHLECSVTGGNPLPVLKWNNVNDSPMAINGNTVTKAISWLATAPDPVDLICQSLHPDRNDSVYVTINVLYPPGPPEITLQTSLGTNVHLNKTLNVIEGRPFTLICSAKSNPQVSLYQWNKMLNGSIYYNANPDRYTDSISCFVSNVMRISDSAPIVNGNSVKHIQLNVLYPPTVNIVRDATLIEGENLDNLCNFTDGNPRVTTISWSWQGNTWNVNPQQPKLVSRNQTGLYRCTVQNLMVTSDGNQVVGNASGELNLSVQYKAKVLRFVINESYDKVNITVNEYDAVYFTCETEGLPLPTVQLLHQSMFNRKVEELPGYSTFQTTTNIRLNSVFQAMCSHNGMHICSGTNTLFNGLKSTSSKNLSLSVMLHINEDTSSSSNGVKVAAGTVGGVVVLVAVIVIAMLYKRRKALSKTNEDTSSQYYNLDAKAGDSNIPVDGVSSNVYEGLQKTDDGCSSNFYEGLQNTGHHKVYENLQLMHNTAGHRTNGSSGAEQEISQKQQTHAIV